MRIDLVVAGMLSLSAVLASADAFESSVNDGISFESLRIHKAAATAAAESAAASSSRSNPDAFDWRAVRRPAIGIGAEYTKVFKDGWDEMIDVLAHTRSCAKLFADKGHAAGEVASTLAATNYKVYAFKKEDGIGAKTLGPVDVEINAAGVFVTGTEGKITLDRRSYDLSEISNVRGMILLHELGHQLGIFGADRDDAALNAHHSLLVIGACFPSHVMPVQH
jgi:hypothetical protein